MMNNGYHDIQGYYFHKPLSVAQMKDLFEQQKG